jgi:hypothetical protein
MLQYLVLTGLSRFGQPRGNYSYAGFWEKFPDRFASMVA